MIYKLYLHCKITIKTHSLKVDYIFELNMQSLQTTFTKLRSSIRSVFIGYPVLKMDFYLNRQNLDKLFFLLSLK